MDRIWFLVKSSLYRGKYFPGARDNSIAFNSILNIPSPKAPLMGLGIWQQDCTCLTPQFTRCVHGQEDTRYTYSGSKNQEENEVLL